MSGDFSLMELFRDEVRSHSATLSSGLLELESDARNPKRIEPLMRAAHSIKGAARIVGVDAAVELAHAMEDALVAAQEQKVVITPAGIDLLLKGTDLIGELAKVADADIASWSAGAKERIGTLVAALHDVRDGKAPPATAPTPPAVPPAAAVELIAVTQTSGDAGGEPADHRPAPSAVGESSPQSPESAIPVDSAKPVGLVPSSTVVRVTPGSVPAVAEKPDVPAEPPGVAAERPDSVVRVTAQSLNRLMNLAGESLVQARWLGPFSSSLVALKQQHDHLAQLVDSIAETVDLKTLPEAVRDRLTQVRQRVSDCRQMLADRTRAFDDHAALAEGLNSRLYHEVIVSRMRPFSDGAGGFPRLVRDMARTLGKNIRLEIVGQNTEVDRDILEKLEAPLNHLLRNAVDHGMETVEDRFAARKPECGTIQLEARHRAGMLSITIADDGKGIDIGRLRTKIVERSLTTADVARSLSDGELLEFLFLPGFSMAPKLTEYSGRGVGLDVVADTIRKIGGSVRVTTELGKGTRFSLQLPLTLSVVRAVLVMVGGEPYAFPHNRIDRLLHARREDVRSLENRQFITVDGQTIGLVVAAQPLGLPVSESDSPMLPVLLMSDVSGTYGLIVDEFVGEQDLVVRTLDPRLGKVPNISAAAILDDGSPVLIADVEDFIRSMDQFIQTGSLKHFSAHEHAASRRKRILIVDDSITVREVERQLLKSRGYDVAVAVDGQDGWNQVRSERFDLVVSDVDMPRMNGLELVKAIRAEGSLADMPVIIVSYKEREEDRLRGLDAGANHYLTKSSFHDNTFLQAVVDLIGEAH